MKLLITSVGSLVGKNILDVLEYPGLSRRHLVSVIGTNSVADSANNFRCDRCYLVPQTASGDDYHKHLREILLKECPDLILCGRDEDTLALSELRERQPNVPGALPVGTPRSALIGLDKWQTFQFARKHGLPFAESFRSGDAERAESLDAFARRVGYPLVAKPVRGFASRGVHFVRDAGDLKMLAQRDGYLFQEYLGDPKSLEPYFESLRGPPPLFTGTRDPGHYSAQTVIAPNGNLAPVLVTFNPLELGQSKSFTRVRDPELDALTVAYARALAAEGALGPVNVAFKKDRRGEWNVQEINLRNSGTTAARFLMGMDEIYLIARDFAPGVPFPEVRPPGSDTCDRVIRDVVAIPVHAAPVSTLNETGVWSRSREN
jgi:carbamoyl-phosphate synthase large subunit